MSEELKLCVNCRHCRIEKIKTGLFRKPIDDFRCVRIGTIYNSNLVTGGRLSYNIDLSCKNERGELSSYKVNDKRSYCGIDGFYFEEKTGWEKLQCEV